jgi:hypothetical protein
MRFLVLACAFWSYDLWRTTDTVDRCVSRCVILVISDEFCESKVQQISKSEKLVVVIDARRTTAPGAAREPLCDLWLYLSRVDQSHCNQRRAVEFEMIC